MAVNRSRTIPALVLALVTAALALAQQADAHGSCTGARMKNVGKRCRAIARCYVSEALGRGDAAGCVAYELQRLERNFHETTIYPDCHPFGDPPDVVSALDASVSNVAGLLQLGSDRCSRAKMDAAGKLCLHLFRDCEAPAEVDDSPVDPACVDEQAALLAKLFQRAERRGDCGSSGDEAAVEAAMQDGIDAAVTELTLP